MFVVFAMAVPFVCCLAVGFAWLVFLGLIISKGRAKGRRGEKTIYISITYANTTGMADRREPVRQVQFSYASRSVNAADRAEYQGI
jgi:hypothetical protein